MKRSNLKKTVKISTSPIPYVSVLALLIVLSGCASIDPSRKEQYYIPPDSDLAQALATEDHSNVGLFVASVDGSGNSPDSVQTLWLNDVMVTSARAGYVKLPLLPGSYRLRNQWETYNPDELTFSIKAGEVKYFTKPITWGGSPYEVSTERKFLEYRRRIRENWGQQWDRRVTLANTRHNFLPANQSALVEQCLQAQDDVACVEVYETIPHVLISPGFRKTMVEVAEAAKKQKADEARQVFEQSLPKTVLRDQYMIALRDALASQDYETALPVFERLQTLEMPLDKDFDYFYGEALHETGKQSEALEAVSRYLRSQGAGAQFYQEALQLLNAIQAAL